MEKQQLKLLPKVGEYYHFFDDGKCSPGRHYICRIERILTLEEAKSIKLTIENELGEFVEHSLYFIWLTERDGHDWVYAKETDFILEVSCPTYDDNTVYAIKINTQDDMNVVMQLYLLDNPWLLKVQNGEQLKNRVFSLIDKAYRDNDILFVGQNCEDCIYIIDSRQSFFERLENLDKEEPEDA